MRGRLSLLRLTACVTVRMASSRSGRSLAVPNVTKILHRSPGEKRFNRSPGERKNTASLVCMWYGVYGVWCECISLGSGSRTLCW